jgi:hypothetical protein
MSLVNEATLRCELPHRGEEKLTQAMAIARRIFSMALW